MPIRLFAFIMSGIPCTVWERESYSHGPQLITLKRNGKITLHNNYTYSKATKFYTHKCHPDIV